MPLIPLGYHPLHFRPPRQLPHRRRQVQLFGRQSTHLHVRHHCGRGLVLPEHPREGRRSSKDIKKHTQNI